MKATIKNESCSKRSIDISVIVTRTNIFKNIEEYCTKKKGFLWKKVAVNLI